MNSLLLCFYAGLIMQLSGAVLNVSDPLCECDLLRLPTPTLEPAWTSAGGLPGGLSHRWARALRSARAMKNLRLTSLA